MSPNASVPCGQSEVFDEFTAVSACVLAVGCLVAALVHLVIIRCAVKLLKQTDDTMHVYMAMLSSSDLLLTAFAFPAGLIFNALLHPTSGFLCVTVHCTSWFGLASSGQFLSLLNADKGLFFAWPRKYRPLSKKNAVLASTVVFAISLSIVASLWTFRVVGFGSPCKFHILRDQKAIYVALALLVCLVPFLSSLAVSVCLLRMYLNRRTASDIANVAFKSRAESLLFICASSVWTAISLLPDRLYMVWYLYAGPSAGCDPMWLKWTAWLCAMLLYSSPIGNCFIVWLTYAPYRAEMSSFVRRLCTK